MLTKSSTGLLIALLSLLPAALAKTDLDGCVSSETVAYGGASLIWYVPDTGEICSFLDCGGGRAPPKTTVPGCAGYEGTASYTPSYLPGFAASTTAPAGGVATMPLTTEPLTPTSSGAASASASASESTTTPESLSQPTTITGSLLSTKTETDLTPPTVTTSAVAGTTGASTSSSTAAAAALATAGAKKILGLAVGVVAGLAAI